MQQAPAVFQEEANPYNFFLCEEGNSWAAALRLVQNCTLRRQIFGEELWLKPMRLIGGALRSEDIKIIRSGAFVLRTPSDRQRRQVLVVDYCRLKGFDVGLSRQRAIFYLMNTGIHENSRRNGVDMLIVISSAGMQMNPITGRMFQAAHTASSFRLHKVVLVRDPNDVRLTLAHLFENMILRIVGKFWGKDRLIKTVVAESPLETRQALIVEGYDPSTIPAALGGDWSYDWVGEYLNNRLREEFYKREQLEPSVQITSFIDPNGRPIGISSSTGDPFATFLSQPAVPPAAVVGERGWKRDYDTLVGTDLIHQTRDELALPEVPESLQSVRERNALYSRRCYNKKKQVQDELELQCSELRATGARLREESERLSKLWGQAEGIVESSR
jgi:hypothetical protein